MRTRLSCRVKMVWTRLFSVCSGCRRRLLLCRVWLGSVLTRLVVVLLLLLLLADVAGARAAIRMADAATSQAIASLMLQAVGTDRIVQRSSSHADGIR